MSFKFRPHRGSLLEAMAECVELADYAALRAHLGCDVTVEPYPGGPGIYPGWESGAMIDERGNWGPTYAVRSAEGLLGFTNGPVKRSGQVGTPAHDETCDHDRLNDHGDACLGCGAVFFDGKWQ